MSSVHRRTRIYAKMTSDTDTDAASARSVPIVPLPSHGAVRRWEDMHSNAGEPIRLATVLDRRPRAVAADFLSSNATIDVRWAFGAGSGR
jgi:hypothetical protein